MVVDTARQVLVAVRTLVVFTVILGIVYPLTVWGVGQVFADRAHGQPIVASGHLVGSRLLGQQFTGEAWFHSRPSTNGYDSLASGPSNLGPSNPALLSLIRTRRAAVARAESVDPALVPPDALTASASGLDPHISGAYARLQAPRVASANNLKVAQVRALIEEHTAARTFGFLGEPGVNVLELNLSIRRLVGD